MQVQSAPYFLRNTAARAHVPRVDAGERCARASEAARTSIGVEFLRDDGEDVVGVDPGLQRQRLRFLAMFVAGIDREDVELAAVGRVLLFGAELKGLQRTELFMVLLQGFRRQRSPFPYRNAPPQEAPVPPGGARPG